MNSYYETQKYHKYYFSKVLSFDEFKLVKSTDGSVSFYICNNIVGQTIVIVKGRIFDNLIKCFFYCHYKARSHVKFIIIDMYFSYFF